MNNFSIYFEHPLLLLLLIPAWAIILIPFLKLPAKRRKTVKKIVPVILHILIAAAAVTLISGINFIHASDEQSVILLLDMSDSTESVKEEIEAEASALMQAIDKNMPVGVVTFGKDAIYSVDINSDSRELEVKEVDGSDTDIEAALQYAATLFPSDKTGRVILLSDGLQTEGDGEQAARFLSSNDIRVDGSYFDSTLKTDEAQVSSFTGPGRAFSGDEISFTAEIKSNCDSDALLMLYDNDVLIDTRSVSLLSGSNIFILNENAAEAAVHDYKLHLSMDTDTVEENNEGWVQTNVAAGPSILAISETEEDGEIWKTLVPEDYSVTLVRPKNAPKTIEELCSYDEVVLINVDKTDLLTNYDTLLQSYVQDYGHSLLTIGGDNTYLYGSMQESAFEDMLPVTFEYTKDDGDPISLILVLDCSMSMSMTSSYIQMAKQGAIKCVNAMSDSDFAGVVSFNSTAYLDSPLIKTTEPNKETLVRIISQLATSQGTYYTEAFKLAHEILEDADTEVRHIIFLSDGNPSDSDYSETIQEIVADGITISTIGLGYSSTILSNIADYAGGRYYFVTREDDLPNIMLSETEQVAADSLVEGYFNLLINTKSELTRDIEETDIPAITGYLGMTAKDEADVYLITEEGDPVYAVWQYGNGTVAAWASDMTGNWSSEWFSSDAGKSIMSRMIKSTVTAEHTDEELLEALEEEADEEAAEAEGSEDAEEQNEETVEFDKDKNGIYYSAEYDAFTSGGDELLYNICRLTGGMVSDDIEELADVQMVVVDLNYTPVLPWAIFMTVLLLADIAIRKIRWKDIKHYFNKIRKQS